MLQNVQLCTEKGLEQICAAICSICKKAQGSLKVLVLNFQSFCLQLTDVAGACIGGLLEECSSYVTDLVQFELNITGFSDMGSKGTSHVASGVSKFINLPQLEKIKLYFTNISYNDRFFQGAVSLFTCFNEIQDASSLQRVNLCLDDICAKKITQEIFVMLCNGLKTLLASTKSLQVLQLSLNNYTQVTNDSCKSLSEVLVDFSKMNIQLTKFGLQIKGWKQCNEEGLIPILKGIQAIISVARD